MKKELFDELVESIKEAGSIKKGKKKANRTFIYEESSVIDIRKRYGLSQDKFAHLMGISVSTLRNWEQGRRKPDGSAQILLKVADKHPEAILDVVS